MTHSIFMQISSAQGPLECEFAVLQTLKELIKEAKSYELELEVIERVTSTHPQCLKSVLLKITGAQLKLMQRNWQDENSAEDGSGATTVLWQFNSPFRVHLKRKNWFVGIFMDNTYENKLDMSDIKIDTMRAQGAGGQHVNKTESAVRITHLPTGIVAICQNERSQHSNKKEALSLLNYRVKAYQNTLQNKKIAERWQQHYNVERGNPVRIFKY